MPKSLIETLQEAAGFDPLRKMNPGSENAGISIMNSHGLLAQAIIPAVLLGFYKYSREEKNAENILTRTLSSDWPSYLFGKNRNLVIHRLALYADIGIDEAEIELKCISELAAEKISEHVGTKASSRKVRRYLADQKPDILRYLPSELQIVELLNGVTQEDRNNNKVIGSLSDTMNKIEQLFLTPENSALKRRV